jgi:hypothetical protein
VSEALFDVVICLTFDDIGQIPQPYQVVSVGSRPKCPHEVVAERVNREDAARYGHERHNSLMHMYQDALEAAGRDKNDYQESLFVITTDRGMALYRLEEEYTTKKAEIEATFAREKAELNAKYKTIAEEEKNDPR